MHRTCRSYAEKTARVSLLLPPCSARVCALLRGGVWSSVVVCLSSSVVPSRRGSDPTSRTSIHLNGLGLRCCLTVPLCLVGTQSDSRKLLVVFLTRLQVITHKSLQLTTQWLIKVRQFCLAQEALPR